MIKNQNIGNNKIVLSQRICKKSLFLIDFTVYAMIYVYSGIIVVPNNDNLFVLPSTDILFYFYTITI